MSSTIEQLQRQYVPDAGFGFTRLSFRFKEEPDSTRFRYKSEHSGWIPGVSSTPDNKTSPTLELVGCRGPADVRVSTVTKEEPYKAHPHELVGPDCTDGVYKIRIPQGETCVTFPKIGIQCVKWKDISDTLKKRKYPSFIRTEPAQNIGPKDYDLKALRLYVEVFLDQGNFKVCLDPVVSQPIYDNKGLPDLKIVKLSHHGCYADGGSDEFILLSKNVDKHIKVRFYEERDGHVIWEAEGKIDSIHKEAICFRPPAYLKNNISEPVKVSVQLKKMPDGKLGHPLPFVYFPNPNPPADPEKPYSFTSWLNEHIQQIFGPDQTLSKSMAKMSFEDVIDGCSIGEDQNAVRTKDVTDNNCSANPVTQNSVLSTYTKDRGSPPFVYFPNPIPPAAPGLEHIQQIIGPDQTLPERMTKMSFEEGIDGSSIGEDQNAVRTKDVTDNNCCSPNPVTQNSVMLTSSDRFRMSYNGGRRVVTEDQNIDSLTILDNATYEQLRYDLKNDWSQVL